MGKIAENKQKIPEDTLINLISPEKVNNFKKRVEAVKKSGKRVGLFGHDNGDPDSFAPLMALKYYFFTLEIEADIFSGGSTGHPMNTTMIKELKIDIRNEILKEDLDKYGFMIMCDGMPNRTSVAQNLKFDIVLDHHENPLIFGENTLLIHDRIGACSTLIYFLMKALKVDLPNDVATALALGISSDTKDFSKKSETTKWDEDAHKELRGIYNYPLFEKIHKWYDLVDGHLAIIGEAYSNRRYIQGKDALVMGVVEVSEGQTAYLSHVVDKAMRTGVKVAIIIANEAGHSIQVKVRENSNLIISNFCKEVFKLNESEVDKASAGGRTGSGGAKIPFTPRELGMWKVLEKETDPEEKRKKKEKYFGIFFDYYVEKIEEYVQKNGI
ncbi:hypothetical protein A2331_04205 [Candidatus Falkowbacteria bacterium RIFOXYB2_FULL_34_18]|uniref:DDH domain-containing protein n=1 Tax=Candidatus Falkowbacteria bacterium RIFOXYD2_FULL_34_120 TaxID=1798007 RepID=A0A1F5TN19_9BACT|nr:MAG: hypothetical protein A2500_00050 [Candidatus Falkowbacteria bacterium RIFOXYC12_FULL_34_55]OGF28830.1 MAG: hypothetical protein A2331_04205 [Candidatus Falkowbacteria bacterium RIFOXYB2_FULL_34_18]OGF38382.1 MAG: hypothetical protein A2515_06515 [Candidatus Falkowbacteria bacterium RIFOXYD12_FULL_34_57]OGF40372.1 MAG: hypothetical protein A2531_00120 [Candidatus Falkowbacteria bacterium RIFOXYD2_FULL_34_120]